MIKITKAQLGKSKILAKGGGTGNVPNVGYGKPTKSRLTKAQEKRFGKFLGLHKMRKCKECGKKALNEHNICHLCGLTMTGDLEIKAIKSIK